MNRFSITLLSLFTLLVSSACSIENTKTSMPENRISVIADPQQKGKLVAVPKPCPTWHREPTDAFENGFEPHFNCAQMYNLGKMIADPKDLLRGRQPGLSDSGPGVLGIERYRLDKKKQLINPKEISSTSKQ